MDNRPATSSLEYGIGFIAKHQRTFKIDIDYLVKSAAVRLIYRSVDRIGRCIVDNDVERSVL